MSFLPGPERRSLREVLNEKLGEVVFGFFPFIRESRPRFAGLDLFEAPEPVGRIIITAGPRPESFLVDSDFDSLCWISNSLAARMVFKDFGKKGT